MQKTIIRGIAVIVTSIILLAGCSAKVDTNHPAVEGVRNYCTMLQMVYVKRDLNVLKSVATDTELKRIFPVVQTLLAADNVMRTQVERFDVQGVRSEDGGRKVIVDTKEKWTFWWEDRKTGTVTKEKKTEEYRLRYELIQNNGRWMVEKVRNL
jgi:hypothetical protein